MMQGLYQIPTRAFSLGTGVLVVDSLASIPIFIYTIYSMIRTPRSWSHAHTLQLGLILLSTWAILNLIDMAVRQGHTAVTYSYILFGCFHKIFRILSDIATLWGLSRVIIRYHTLHGQGLHSALRIPGNILVFVGVYHLCLNFSLAFSWLSFVDLGVINKIATSAAKFEICFAALYFIFSGGALGCAIAVNQTIPAEKRPYAIEQNELMLASLLLFIRSFCEVVIAGQLYRHPFHHQDILRTRNITYHLFGAAFAVAIVYAIPDRKNLDPLCERKTMAKDFVKNLMDAEIDKATDGGRKTAPELAEILNAAIVANPDIEVQREVRRLKRAYQGWVPIFK